MARLESQATAPFDIRREAQKYGSDGSEGNMVLPNIAGFLVITAAEQLGMSVNVDAEIRDDSGYSRTFHTVMGVLEKQHGAEAANQIREAAVGMIPDSGVGSLAETLRLYMKQFKVNGLQGTSTAA